MNLLCASYLRKTGAMLFLVLFVFAHAFKALHTHEVSLVPSHYHGDNSTADVKAAFSCSICDFQIAKDSDVPVNTAGLTIPIQCISVIYGFTLAGDNSAVTTSSGLDPPFA